MEIIFVFKDEIIVRFPIIIKKMGHKSDSGIAFYSKVQLCWYSVILYVQWSLPKCTLDKDMLCLNTRFSTTTKLHFCSMTSIS